MEIRPCTRPTCQCGILKLSGQGAQVRWTVRKLQHSAAMTVVHMPGEGRAACVPAVSSFVDKGGLVLSER
ncbi:hypothetical protein PROFUN_13940 [Planoprotostelium fungivorum]|uniref:Uncharacterized protein n=1 Tax=Planoprotostelium fungivorum TaxID=1890364 RepID=A0A2P6N2F3_9EUKA|nr:hypothetical protein PROFUN_13940 [Planoprotostelium fungivorum]